MNAIAIVEESRKWLGVPYLHQGRTANGLDCIGLAVVVAHALEVSDYDIDGYSRVPSGHMMKRLLSEQMRPIPVEDARMGDFLHLAFSGQPQHIAIITKTNPVYIIHADSVFGKVVEHRLDDKWRARVRGAYRLPGLDL